MKHNLKFAYTQVEIENFYDKIYII